MENSAKKERKGNGIVKFIISAICLLLVFAMLFNVTSRLLVHPEDGISYSMIKGFYDEEENSLDAVFIGSSTTYADWNPILAWENYGITGFSLTSPAQPFSAQEELCKEARKTQPDAVYVFNLVPICEYFDEDEVYGFHVLLDYMPFSINKLKIAHAMCKGADMTLEESMEFYIPFIRYHDQWTSWDGENFNKPLDGFKGVPHYVKFFRGRYNLTDQLYSTEETAKFTKDTEKIKDAVNSLTDYLKEENVKAFFITTPTVGKDEEVYKTINSAEELVKAAGFDVIDYQNLDTLDEMNISLKEDFYNHNHLNVHGALKSTSYISEYMIEKFGLKDKRNDAGYTAAEGWNEALENYKKKMAPYVLDQEHTKQIDYTYAAPAIKAAADESGAVEISWKHDDGADKYVIYKKDMMYSKWREIATLSGDELSFTDTSKAKIEESADESMEGPYYTVIACRNDGGKDVWSEYNHKGVLVKTGGAQ